MAKARVYETYKDDPLRPRLRRENGEVVFECVDDGNAAAGVDDARHRHDRLLHAVQRGADFRQLEVAALLLQLVVEQLVQKRPGDNEEVLSTNFVHLGGGGRKAQWIAFSLPAQQPQVQFLAFPRFFLTMLLRFIDGTTCNSGQRLVNVKQTHLGLVSGKLVLQKTLYSRRGRLAI